MERFTDDEIAQVIHEANRGLQAVLDDPRIPVAPSWDDFPDKHTVVEGVRLTREGATPEQSHEAWCASKRADGWVTGEVKDPEAKTHPSLVPYDELPEGDKTKDYLFQAIVSAMSSTDYVVVSEHHDGDWGWTRYSGNHKKVGTAGEGHQDKAYAVLAAAKHNPGIRIDIEEDDEQ